MKYYYCGFIAAINQYLIFSYWSIQLRFGQFIRIIDTRCLSTWYAFLIVSYISFFLCWTNSEFKMKKLVIISRVGNRSKYLYRTYDIFIVLVNYQIIRYRFFFIYCFPYLRFSFTQCRFEIAHFLAWEFDHSSIWTAIWIFLMNQYY